jgi:hypothetical protein
LGQIGNNQEHNLPKKYFSKKSFPLLRDLANRTIVKSGKITTPFLIDVLESNKDIFIKCQAIDAIGSITHKYNDHRALNSLIKFSDEILKLRNQNLNDEDLKSNTITIWKLIRNLSGFKKSEYVLNLLFKLVNNFDFNDSIAND